MRHDSFQVSSFCTGGGCLGVAIADDGVHLTNTAADKVVEIHVSRDEWAAFVAGVKNGEFDLSDS